MRKPRKEFDISVHNLFIVANRGFGKTLNILDDCDLCRDMSAVKLHFYIRTFEDFIKDLDYLKTIKELLYSNDKDNLIIAYEMIINLKIKE